MIQSNKAVKITLAHINDTHSYFDSQPLQLHFSIDGETLSPYVSNGGFARIATRIKELKTLARKQRRNFLFLHAGDCFQGTLYFSLFKGKANSEMLNKLGIDAMALGNHELDLGNTPIAEFLEQIHFPLLAGNWDLSNEAETKSHRLNGHPNLFAYQPNTGTARWITRIIDEEPIAIFGLSLDKMTNIANVDPDTPFVNAISTAKKTLDAIRNTGINKIILLSHLGFDTDAKLAREVSGISLIVGGHTHCLQGNLTSLGLTKETEYGYWVNNTYIVQAGCHSQALGHCEIDFAADGSITSFKGGNELLIGRYLYEDAQFTKKLNKKTDKNTRLYLTQHKNIAFCSEDSEIRNLLENKYIPRVRKLQNTVIARIEKNMRHIRIPDLQGGSDIAPLVAESFAYMMKKNGHNVDFAIHNAGGVRTSLKPGNVSVADIAGKLLPFAIPIGVYRIKGKYIAQALEGAINNATNNGVLGTGSGSYPYVYNLNFNYHADRPQGKRIADLAIYTQTDGWTSIKEEKIYHGSSSAYTMKGKEGYSALTMMEGDGIVSQYSMADCFIDFIQGFPNRF